MQMTYWQPAVPFKVYRIFADICQPEEDDDGDLSPDDFTITECTFLGMETRNSNGNIDYYIAIWNPLAETVVSIDAYSSWDSDSGYAVCPNTYSKKDIDAEVRLVTRSIFSRWKEINC